MVQKKQRFINQMKTGDKVKDLFSISRKQVLENKKKEPYCRIELMDRTGTIEGILWPECYEAFKDVKEGDFVSIEGFITEYNGKDQVTVKKVDIIDEKDIEEADYMHTRFGKDEKEMMKSELIKLTGETGNGRIKKLLDSFFADEAFLERFAESTAALQYHHAYPCGLIEHTLSVTSICQDLVCHYERLASYIDRDLVLAGALLHDVGKVSEYSTDSRLGLTDRGKLLGHIALGYSMVEDKIRNIEGFDPALKDSILHIILSHHGFEEYGSPKQPKTIEAFIVFHADYIDADIGGYETTLEKTEESMRWSPFVKQFRRSLLVKRKEGKKVKRKEINKKDQIPEDVKDSIEKALSSDDKDKKQDGLF